MADDRYDDLSVSLVKTSQGDHYQLGVEVDGAWVPFGSINAPEFEQRVVEAAAVAAAAKSQSKSK